MDKIRKEMEIKIYNLKNFNVNYRLIKKEELPLWAY